MVPAFLTPGKEASEMPHSNPTLAASQLGSLRQRWARTPGLLPPAVLPPTQVEAVLQAQGVTWRDRIFTPLVTVYAFLGQILDPDYSCRQAVARVLAWLLRCGRPVCSAETGAYCKARRRLPEGVLARLTRDTGQQLATRQRRRWHWHGHQVKLLDGSSVTAPDTRANQRAYPQHSGQKPGLGFPLVRIVVLFSLAVGTVLDAAYGPYKGKQTAETALWRALRHNLQPGDILLADRYHGSFWEVAAALERGSHVVLRVHQRRQVDFRRGQRLGADDHVVTWTKYRTCPGWMDRRTYDALPQTLRVREIRIRVPKGRCRTREIVVVTTLLDSGRYPKGEIAALYRRRWQVEVDLRSLKQTLQMDSLRGQSPAMLHKELWAHFLVYNLLRTLQTQAAERHGCRPEQISFKGTWQTLNAFTEVLGQDPPEHAPTLYDDLLGAIATHRVGDRPDRVEPRARKRRGQKYPWLTEPRLQAQQRLAKGR
jgi:hypothetical protein